MDLGLTGKLALVTGSTAGIGFSIARQLAREGATVYVNGRTQARVDHAVQQIGGGSVKGVAADLATRAGCDALVAQVPRLDVLVNNFGTFEIKPVLEISDDDWTHMFEANVLSGVRLARAYMPGMLAKKWGRIVFISSESAIQIPSEMVHYGVTKTAQLAVARGSARDRHAQERRGDRGLVFAGGAVRDHANQKSSFGVRSPIASRAPRSLRMKFPECAE
jgi:NAD(P)-dependent dehydrogenase (short-subunit alcohol dehydrogenase family)